MIQPRPDFDVDAYCEKLARSGSEHAHQRAFFGWLNHFALTTYPDAKYAFAIPNGGKRDPITAARLKAEGVKAGVPDICYPIPSIRQDAVYHSLYVEMKAGSGRASADQGEWHSLLRRNGNAVAVCWGWRSAVQCFNDYVFGRLVAMEYKSVPDA